MAVPNFLNTNFHHAAILTADVADIITALRDLLLTQPVAAEKWTEPVSGTFMSPVRSDKMSFSLQVTKISASRIAYIVKDHNGTQVNNQTDTRQDINTTGSTNVNIFTSPYCVFVDSLNVAQTECFGCGVLDRTPEPITDPRPVYWCSSGPRLTTGSIGAYNNWGFVWLLRAGTTAYNNAGGYAIDKVCLGATYTDMFTLSGTMLFYPLEYVDGAIIMGRVFGALLTDCSQSNGATFQVPLDSGTTGTFKIIGWNIIGASKVAMRIS